MPTDRNQWVLTLDVEKHIEGIGSIALSLIYFFVFYRSGEWYFNYFSYIADDTSSPSDSLFILFVKFTFYLVVGFLLPVSSNFIALSYAYILAKYFMKNRYW